MNEELLNAMYNQTNMSDANISKEEYANLLLENEDLRRATYSEMGFENENVSMDDFESLLGFKKKVQEEPSETTSEETPQVEQEGMESVSEVGSSESQKDDYLEFTVPEEKTEAELEFFKYKGYYPGEEKQALEEKQETTKEWYDDAVVKTKETLGEDFDYLSKTTEEIADMLPAEVDDQSALQVIEERKAEALNKKGSEYYNQKIAKDSEVYLNQNNSIEEAEDLAYRDYLKSMRSEGISYLGLDESDSKKYKTYIDEYYKLRQIPFKERTPEEKARVHELKDIVSELKENPTKSFINPDTGEVDGEKEKLINELASIYSVEVKNDFQKFTDRYKKEYDNIRSLRSDLYNTFKDNYNVGESDNMSDELIQSLKTDYENTKPGGLVEFLGLPSQEEMDAFSKADVLFKEYQKSTDNFAALSRALLLNEDPGAVSRGFEMLEGIPVLEEVGTFATSFGESFAEAIPGVENVSTDRDFRKAVVNIANEEGVKLTQEQYDSAVDGWSEKLGDTFGTSAEIMAEIIGTTLITKNASSFLGISDKLGKLVNVLGGGEKAAKYTGVALQGLEQAIAFDLASQGSAAMGVGEFFGAKGADRLLSILSKGKTGKFMKLLKPLTRVMGATTAGTIEEYGGEYLDQAFRNGFLSEETFRNTFGRDYDEAKDKLLLTMILAGTFGTGAEVANMYRLGKDYYKDSGDVTQLNDVEKAYKEIQKARTESELTRFDDMSDAELEQYAKDNNVEIEDLKKTLKGKKELISEEKDDSEEGESVSELAKQEDKEVNEELDKETLASNELAIESRENILKEDGGIFKKSLNKKQKEKLQQEVNQLKKENEEIRERQKQKKEKKEETKDFEARYDEALNSLMEDESFAKLDAEHKDLMIRSITESDPNVKAELKKQYEKVSNKRLALIQQKLKGEDSVTGVEEEVKTEPETKVEVKAEDNTFTEEISELAKEDNKEVADYIEMRSAEELSKVLDGEGVLDKISKGESINDKKAEEYTNKIYDLIDSENVEEGSVKESELYDVIEKVENYDNKTKTVEETTTKTRLLTRFRENAGQVSQKAFRDQVSGSEVDFKGNKGTVEVEGGSIVFKTDDGVKNLGSATDILTQDFTTDNILKDENGNVSGVRMNTPEGEITINNPEVGLDLGIQLQEKIIGRNPLKDIEVAYEEVISEEGIEVKVEKPKVEIKAEEKIEEAPVDLETPFTKEELTSKLEGSALKKVFDKIDALDKKLKGKALSDPFLITPTVRLILKGVKAGLKAGMTLEAAIKKAKLDAKKSTEYKVLRKEDQNFIDNSSVDDLISRADSESKGEAPKREDTREDELNLELDQLINESLDTEKPKTDKDVRKIQKRFRDFISANKKILRDASPALNATIANKIASVSSPATLKSTAEYISKIIKDTNFKKEQEARAKKIDDIRKALDPKSFKSKGSKPASGKIAIEAQDFFDKARRMMGLTKEEASSKYDKILEKYKDFDDISINDKELLLALDFADLENKTDAELDNLTQLVKEYTKEGREWLKRKKEARKQEYNDTSDKVYEAVTAGEDVMTVDEYESSKKAKGLSAVKRDVSKFVDGLRRFLNYNEAWRGIVGEINRLSKSDTGSTESARNFLNSIIDPVDKAASDKVKGMQSFIKEVRSKKKEIFGSDYKKKIKKHNKQTIVKDASGNEILVDGKPLRMSDNEAMYIYNLMKDSSLDPTIEKMSKKSKVSKAKFEEARRRVESNTELKEYADWVHNDFYPNYYNKINAEYRKQYDFNLPFNSDYSPIKRSGYLEQEVDPLNPTMNIASTLNGSLKERVSNTQDIVLDRSIDEVMLNYADQMEHFIHYTDVVKLLNRVFSNPKVKNAINQKAGEHISYIVNKTIKDLANMPKERSKELEVMAKLRRNFTTAVLGLNTTLFPKQLASAPAYAVQAESTGDFLKESVKMFSKSGFNDFMFIMKSDFIKDRMGSGFDRDTALAMRKDAANLFSGTNNLASKLMFMTKWGDVGAILLGGTPYFRSQRNKYLKQGMSETKANQKALADFEVATKSVQQSSNIEEQSTFQRGGEWAKMMTMFKTSQAQYFRKSYDSWRNIIRGRGNTKDVKNIVMFQAVLPALFTLASKGLTWDDEDELDYLESIALGNMEGLAIAGDLVGYFMDKVAGRPFEYNVTPAFTGITKIIEAVAKELSSEEGLSMEDIMDDILIPLGESSTGLPIKNAKKLTIDNLIKIGNGDYETDYEILELIGWSPWVLNRGVKKEEGRKRRRRSDRSTLRDRRNRD